VTVAVTVRSGDAVLVGLVVGVAAEVEGVVAIGVGVVVGVAVGSR
jgi:hypothetical protein